MSVEQVLESCLSKVGSRRPIGFYISQRSDSTGCDPRFSDSYLLAAASGTGLQSPLLESYLTDSVSRRAVYMTAQSLSYDSAHGLVGDESTDDQAREVSAFLESVYASANSEDLDSAIDVIFEYINSLMVEGRVDACDNILAKVDIARLPPVLMVSFLTITAAAKPKLRNRSAFFAKVNRTVAASRGHESAERLLDGLD